MTPTSMKTDSKELSRRRLSSLPTVTKALTSGINRLGTVEVPIKGLALSNGFGYSVLKQSFLDGTLCDCNDCVIRDACHLQVRYGEGVSVRS